MYNYTPLNIFYTAISTFSMTIKLPVCYSAFRPNHAFTLEEHFCKWPSDMHNLYTLLPVQWRCLWAIICSYHTGCDGASRGSRRGAGRGGGWLTARKDLPVDAGLTNIYLAAPSQGWRGMYPLNDVSFWFQCVFYFVSRWWWTCWLLCQGQGSFPGWGR